MQRNITNLDYLLSSLHPRRMSLITRSVKNWYDLILFRSGARKEVTLVLRSGRRIRVRNASDYYNFMNTTMDWAVELARMEPKISIGKNTMKIRFLDRDVSLYFESAASLGNSARLAIQQFVEEEYSWLDVRGKDVIDIGSSVADTSIYFALRGAKHVYAIEPYVRTHEIAKKNVKLNGLGRSITLLNKALSANSSFVRMKKSSRMSIDSVLSEGIAQSGKRIELMTLEGLMKRYNIRKGILKMDCEGCEYESILSSSNETLSKFDQIMLEYHYGYIDLEGKLRSAGFEVRHTTPSYGGYHNPNHPKMYMGLIFAKKT